MEVEWRNLSVSIGEKQILSPCSGLLRPGRMVALMGPSGSGKTSFLNCLRQNIAHAGEVRFDGARFGPQLRQLIGFVEQDDVVIPQLTVRQSLLFLAELRLGIGTREAAAAVEQVMESLRLGKIADSVIGESGASARISGGERKRLCIARELLGEPRLLLCDEPTSGLDSTMADQVMANLRSLCTNGKVSVLAAIHQPSTHIFARFDELLLLKDGEVVYWGPACDAEALFTAHCSPRHSLQSTAEYLMDLVTLEPAPESAEGKGSSAIASGMSRASLAGLLAHVHMTAAALPPLAAPSLAKQSQGSHAAPVLRQLLLLSRRHWSLLHKELFTTLSLVQNIGLMLIAALLWVQLQFSEEDVRSRWGTCLWTAGTWMFFPIFGGMNMFPPFRRVLEKELGVGCYSLGAFYTARTILLLPLELAWPTLWITGVFWIANLNPDFSIFIQFILVVYLSYCVFHGLGIAISASGMPPGRSNTFALLLITYFFAWSGFFVDMSRVPEWISWVRHLNAFGYAVQLLMHTIIPASLEFDCEVSSAAGIQQVSEGCKLKEGSAGGSYVLAGDEALSRIGITAEPWLCIAFLFGCLFFFRVLAFLLLRWDLRSATIGAKEHNSSPQVESKIVSPGSTAAATAGDVEDPRDPADDIKQQQV
ncbi:unnamed protein product [Polarella glacialis]|uniref:ABC transporter domain-containing protein n=1 Tax=Polarella glacialis TaxID=89957 RepID=A0A813DQ86_POLGL|nr:unnamed protein product [Polarella glacialis]